MSSINNLIPNNPWFNQPKAPVDASNSWQSRQAAKTAPWIDFEDAKPFNPSRLRQFDEDKNGYLTREEIVDSFKDPNLDAQTKKDLSVVLKKMDEAGIPFVPVGFDDDEFDDPYDEPAPFTSGIKDNFYMLDEDGSNSLEISELEEMLKNPFLDLWLKDDIRELIDNMKERDMTSITEEDLDIIAREEEDEAA